jgi:riboflavin synthase alpha subunit
MMCQVEVIWDWQLKEIFCNASGHWLGGHVANIAHVPHLKQNDGSYNVL